MYVDSLTGEAGATRRLQRADGRARISFHRKDGATRLDRLFQEGCAKLRLPKPLAGGPPETVVINTAGGLTGGDRFALEVSLGAEAEAVVTTQACERIYRSTGDTAAVSATLRLGDRARLAWLPQETILFDGGRLSRRLEADLAGDAELVALESVVFGRTAMGEAVTSGALHDRWRIRRDGRLVFADDLRFEGAIADRLAERAVLDGAVAMATVLYVGAEPERKLEGLREAIGPDGGASAWNGKLLARIRAADGLGLRRRLEPVLTRLVEPRTLPKVWQL